MSSECGGGRRLTYEHLAHSTARSEAENVLPHSRIPGHKVQSGTELTRVTSNIHAEPLSKTSGNQPRADDQVNAGNNSAHDVVGTHHLRSRVRSEGLEDVVLSAVRQAIKQEVDAKKQ